MSAIMVFDVESVGLHGEGFAVGFVVIDTEGKELDHGRFACPVSAARGSIKGREWVERNILPPPAVTHAKPIQVRDAFWAKWMEWREKGAMLAADCPWPVEARFLMQCVEDAQHEVRGQPLDDGPRGWDGPYPLLDVASMMFAVGLDPLATHERLPNELPVHDPLADARQSARLLATTPVPS